MAMNEMSKYPKIDTVFKRDEKGRLIDGVYSRPEFEFLKDITWEFTEKIDGTNIRVSADPDNQCMIFKGRTDNAQIPTFLLDRLVGLFSFAKFTEVFDLDCDVCLYGEGFGNKIQKIGKKYNPYGVDFVLFDVRINGLWLRRNDVEDIANKLGIKAVPCVGRGTLQDGIDIVRRGFFSAYSSSDDAILAEGLVMRPVLELLDRRGRRIITKIKHKDFAGAVYASVS